MTEIRYLYQLNNQADSATLNGRSSTEADTLRAELEDLERRLIPLLITIQRALGKEPSIITRSRQAIK